MESRNLPTITVGIPAYNESKNIIPLLASILSQKGAFILKKIIVVSDGSTDGTDEAVRFFAKTNPKVALLSDGKRLGKAQRLNQLYAMNMNDYIVVFDGDVLPKNTKVIDTLLRRFTSTKVVVVGGNVLPVPAENIVEKLINGWNEVWFEVQKHSKSGNSIHNVYGRIMALRRDFAKSIHFPAGTISEPQYIYFSAISLNLSFVFAKNAVVFFSPPATLEDYAKQYHRHIGETRKNADIFGEWIYDEFFIPRDVKVKAFARMLLKKPLMTIAAVVFHMWFARTSKPVSSVKQPGIWDVVASTKRELRIGMIKG